MKSRGRNKKSSRRSKKRDPDTRRIALSAVARNKLARTTRLGKRERHDARRSCANIGTPA